MAGKDDILMEGWKTLDEMSETLHPANPEHGIMGRETIFFRSIGSRTNRSYEATIAQPEYTLRLVKRDGFPLEIEIAGQSSYIHADIDTLIALLEKTKENLK